MATGRFSPRRCTRSGPSPSRWSPADLSGNGYDDLVTANRTSGDLTILWARRGEASRRRPSSTAVHAPSALAVADFNGDGRIDLAVADEQDDQVTILSNLGGGHFAPTSSFDIGQAADFLQVLYPQMASTEPWTAFRPPSPRTPSSCS